MQGRALQKLYCTTQHSNRTAGIATVQRKRLAPVTDICVEFLADDWLHVDDSSVRRP